MRARRGEPLGLRRFRIEECMGVGGYGDVFRAQMRDETGHSEEVALKVLRSSKMANENAFLRMRDEARVLGMLTHPCILRFVDLVHFGDRLCLVTEFIDGADLKILWKRDGFSAKHAVEVAAAVGSALDAALQLQVPSGGALGLVHRDIKPTNIRVNKRGDVKLLDFGIALFDSVDREASTQTGFVLGSVGYMAPEQLTSSRCTSKADVFSLATILYEGCARKRLMSKQICLYLLRGNVNENSLHAYVKREIASIPNPSGLHELLLEMLRLPESKRPSAHEVASRCAHIASELPGPSLAEWCQSRTWEPAEQFHSGWIGLELTEREVVKLR